MTPILAFDIETVPDAEGVRRVMSFGPELSDASVVEFALQRRRQASGNDFLPPYLQRVVAISCALRERDSVRVWSLGATGDAERDIVQRFFDGIEKYTPQLVSWNGSGFDLPVLHYRAMVHGIPGCCYWDVGDNNKDFRFNNYLSRFHARHTDLAVSESGISQGGTVRQTDAGIDRRCGPEQADRAAGALCRRAIRGDTGIPGHRYLRRPAILGGVGRFLDGGRSTRRCASRDRT